MELKLLYALPPAPLSHPAPIFISNTASCFRTSQKGPSHHQKKYNYTFHIPQEKKVLKII